MPYNDLRPYSCRPTCCHPYETPDVSPCRVCEHSGEDKNEFPSCVSCTKLDNFKSIPVNLEIRHDQSPKRKTFKHRERKNLPDRSVPEGTLCSVPGCGKKAHYTHYKDQYQGYICIACYVAFNRQFKKTGKVDPALRVFVPSRKSR